MGLKKNNKLDVNSSNTNNEKDQDPSHNLLPFIITFLQDLSLLMSHPDPAFARCDSLEKQTNNDKTKQKQPDPPFLRSLFLFSFPIDFPFPSRPKSESLSDR